jgi:hypothetical protein
VQFSASAKDASVAGWQDEQPNREGHPHSGGNQPAQDVHGPIRVDVGQYGLSDRR